MLTFYHAPGSSSMAVLIALYEAGAEFEIRKIALDAREKDPPEFAALNPEGKVPTLVIDGTPLTEVAGVLYYLARAYPGAALWPSGDPLTEARVISWMSFIASSVHPARRQGEEHARQIWTLADQRFGKGPWAVGPFSIADIHLFRLFWRFGRNLGTYANLTAHYDRMIQRESVRKTLETDASLGYALP